MTKSRVKANLKTNPRTKHQRNRKEYVDFSRISETLGVLFSPLLSSIYFSFPRPNIKNANPQVQPKNTNLKRSKSYSKIKHQCGVKHNIMTINLHKIEENLALNCKQTKKLKDILEKIKYETDSDGGMGKVREKMKGVEHNCANSRRKVKDSKYSKTEKMYTSSSKKCKDSHKDISREYCKEVISKGNSGKKLLSVKDPATKSCDSGCVAHTNPSSISTRTIVRAKPEMNIGNLRIRCIRPVCVVYTARDSEEFSQAAFKAHLGSGRCPVVSEIRRSSPDLRAKMSMHHIDDDQEEYVIAKGTLTEELVESFKALKEIRKSLFPETQDDSESFDAQYSRGSTPYTSTLRRSTLRRSTKPSLRKSSSTKLKMRNSLRHSLEEPIDEPYIQKVWKLPLELSDVVGEQSEKAHWDVESFPSTLQNLEKDSLNLKTKPEESHRQSVLSKLKGCVYSVLPCTCFTSSSPPSISGNDVRFSKLQKIPSSYSNKKLKAMRTTESEFIRSSVKNVQNTTQI